MEDTKTGIKEIGLVIKSFFINQDEEKIDEEVAKIEAQEDKNWIDSLTKDLLKHNLDESKKKNKTKMPINRKIEEPIKNSEEREKNNSDNELSL